LLESSPEGWYLFDLLKGKLVTKVTEANGVFTRDSLEARMLKPINFARERGLQVYCGEWGSYPTIDQSVRLTWYRDMRSILEEHGVAWTTWDYKGGFGIRDRNTGESFDELISVLVD